MRYARPLLAAVVLCTAASVGVQAEAGATTSVPQLVSGVLNISGVGVSDGTVLARLWPDDQTTATLPEGASFDLYEIGTATTGDDGAFSFALDPTTIPADYIDNDGRVDVEILGGNDVVMTTRFTTVEFIRDVTDANEAAETSPNPTLPVIGTWVAADNAAVPAAVDLDLGTIRDDSALDEYDVALPDVAPAVILDSILAAAPGGGCHQSAGARRGPYLETFATIYGDGGVKGRVAQSTSSSHTLGVGVKSPGDASFSASGTETEASGFGYDSNFTVADAAVQNKVYYRDYTSGCATSTGAVYTTEYERPDGFYQAGPYYKYAGHTNYTTCDIGFVDHSYWRSSSKNGQFSAGVELPGPNLSAQSGFSSSQEVAYHFTKQGKLCGSGGKPWGSAPRMSARTS